jgi:DNA transposition AAA+ family ATPase
MKITNALRKRINLFLPKNYRKEIVDRLKKRNIKVHPNTVSHTLNGGNNDVVAAEILQLANEQKERLQPVRRKIKLLAAQL